MLDDKALLWGVPGLQGQYGAAVTGSWGGGQSVIHMGSDGWPVCSDPGDKLFLTERCQDARSIAAEQLGWKTQFSV